MCCVYWVSWKVTGSSCYSLAFSRPRRYPANQCNICFDPWRPLSWAANSGCCPGGWPHHGLCLWRVFSLFLRISAELIWSLSETPWTNLSSDKTHAFRSANAKGSICLLVKWADTAFQLCTASSLGHTQQTWDVGSTLVYSWPSDYDAGPTVNQH